LLNPALINPPPPTSINDSSLNPLALAFLYANQHHQQNSSNTQVQQQQQQQPRIHSQQISVPPTTTMPLNFQPQQQQQPQVATPQQQIYNPNNIQISDIQKQIEQQAILNQLSQLISSLGQSQIPPPPQIGSVYNPMPQQFHQQQHQNAMSKPPILTPSQPIQIPKPQQQQQQFRQSLPTSTPESNRKRRHRDIEIISSQSSSQSSSPNNNNNINASRSRAFTCPETMKEKQQPSQKNQSDHPSSPDKIAKFDPSCPLRHHPDNLSPPNEEAMLLEQITTAYLLNSLGESAYKASNPKDENKSKQFGIESNSETNEKSGNIVKIPMSEIHRIIEDCFSE
jgi:hypothetical protein